MVGTRIAMAYSLKAHCPYSPRSPEDQPQHTYENTTLEPYTYTLVNP